MSALPPAERYKRNIPEYLPWPSRGPRILAATNYPPITQQIPRFKMQLLQSLTRAAAFLGLGKKNPLVHPNWPH